MRRRIYPEIERLKEDIEEFLEVTDQEMQKIPTEEEKKKALMILIDQLGRYQKLSGPGTSVLIEKILSEVNPILLTDMQDMYEEIERIIKQLLRREMLEGHSLLIEPLQRVLVKMINKGEPPINIAWAFYTIRENLLEELRRFKLTLEDVQWLVSPDGIGNEILKEFYQQLKNGESSSQ